MKFEDGDLALRLRQRDPRALAELYDRYGKLAYLLIYRIVENESAAEDLVQEVFLRIWDGMSGYDETRGTLGRWLLAVARNRAIDYVRSWEGRMSRGAMPVEDWARFESPAIERELLDRDLVQALQDALERLTPQQRAILNLAYMEGLTHTEMAERLKRPLGTVKTWVRNALRALREEMDPMVGHVV